MNNTEKGEMCIMLSGNVRGGSCGQSMGVVADERDRDRKWNALDPTSQFPFSKDDAAIFQEVDQAASIGQRSREVIVIKDSLDVKVTSTETQVAASLQAALQVAIALVVNLTIADSDQAEKVTQDLLQFSRIEQVNKQSVFIENCREVDVKITDTDIAISIQLMLQLLLALLIQIDVF